MHRTRATLSGLFAVLLLVAMVGVTSPGEGAPNWEVARADAAAGAGDTVPGQILVRFADDAPGNASERARAGVGAKEIGRIDPLGVEVWRVPAHAAERAVSGLQRNPHVDYAEHDTVVELEEVIPNDPDFDRQWGLAKVEAPTAWMTSQGSADVTIAILDTGVQPVDDLMDKLLPGHNVLDGSSDTSDSHGHGTMSAGVAAASTDNGLDVAGYCWSCSLLPVKVLDEGAGYMSDLAAGIVWAADNGADVISMSLSGPSGATTVLNATRYAQDRDIVLVAAAGNQGDTAKRYPAAYDEVIAVAGSRSDDTLYSWSNYGLWVDVAAPGANRTTHPDGGTFNYGGTSSAAPAVAGILGLARATGASAAESRAALQDGSVPLDGIRYGRVDAAQTLRGLGDVEPEPNVDPVADFTVACDELTCAFDASASYDEDGHITSYGWDLGDGTSATGEQVSHVFAAEGTYAVALVVTDDGNATDALHVDVDVTVDDEPEPDPEPDPEPEPEPDSEPEDDIQLAISTSKARGIVSAHLSWTGADGGMVDIRVDGGLYATVADGGGYTHNTGERGNPTITYEVCDADRCSDPVTVDSW